MGEQEYAETMRTILHQADAIHSSLQEAEEIIARLEAEAEQAGLGRLKYQARDLHICVSRAAHHLVEAHVALIGEELSGA